MAVYSYDFGDTFKNEVEFFSFLENHYAGNTDFDSDKEFDVIEAESFDDDNEPVGKFVDRTVVISPVIYCTGGDSERGETFGYATGRHEIYWA